jgi:hypothetical protein
MDPFEPPPLRTAYEMVMDAIAAAESFEEVDRMEREARARFANDERLAKLEQLIAGKRIALANPRPDDPPAAGFGTDVL